MGAVSQKKSPTHASRSRSLYSSAASSEAGCRIAYDALWNTGAGDEGAPQGESLLLPRNPKSLEEDGQQIIRALLPAPLSCVRRAPGPRKPPLKESRPYSIHPFP